PQTSRLAAARALKTRGAGLMRIIGVEVQVVRQSRAILDVSKHTYIPRISRSRTMRKRPISIDSNRTIVNLGGAEETHQLGQQRGVNRDQGTTIHAPKIDKKRRGAEESNAG